MDDKLFDYLTDDERHTYARVALQQTEVDLKLAQVELEDKQSLLIHTNASGHKNGRFAYVGSVTENGVHILISQITHYNAEQRLLGNNRPYSRILLNSGGGSVVDGLALVDFIKDQQRDGAIIDIIGTGEVASMAGIVLQAASTRMLTPRAYMLIHEISSQIAGTISHQDDTRKFIQSLEQTTLDILSERSTMTKRAIKAMQARKDVYLDAQRALKLGFIDKITEE